MPATVSGTQETHEVSVEWMVGWMDGQMHSDQPNLAHHTCRTILVILPPPSNQRHNIEGRVETRLSHSPVSPGLRKVLQPPDLLPPAPTAPSAKAGKCERFSQPGNSSMSLELHCKLSVSPLPGQLPSHTRSYHTASFLFPPFE